MKYLLVICLRLAIWSILVGAVSLPIQAEEGKAAEPSGVRSLEVKRERLVEFHGDRFSIKAHNNTLREVLEAFVDYGVRVEVDPGIKMKVNGALEEADSEKNLALLLSAYSYRISWKQVPGPEGTISRLSLIKVFRPGHEQGLEAIFAADAGKFSIVRGPDGTLYIRDEVLLGVVDGTSLDAFKALVASVNGVVVESVPSLGIYRIKLPRNSSVPGVVKRLLTDPRIAAAEPNLALQQEAPQPLVNNGSTEAPSLDDAAKPSVREGAQTVAVLDSGLQQGIDFGDALQGAFDATQPGEQIGDGSGHGTQMAMIVSGMVAPTGTENETGVPLLAIRAFDDKGVASSFSLMQSIDYAVENDARLLSMSWGTDSNSEFLERSVGYANDKGLIVVAAAGNEPSGKAVYPAAYDNVIAVGALDASGELWDQSNRGDFIDVTAPGQAAFPVGHNGPPGNYAGTSIATPYVAKALSQYTAIYPEAKSDQMMETFYDSLTDAGAPGKDPIYGNGTLDNAALERFLSTPPKP